jgi:hypothetical protein
LLLPHHHLLSLRGNSLGCLRLALQHQLQRNLPALQHLLLAQCRDLLWSYNIWHLPGP